MLMEEQEGSTTTRKTALPPEKGEGKGEKRGRTQCIMATEPEKGQHMAQAITTHMEGEKKSEDAREIRGCMREIGNTLLDWTANQEGIERGEEGSEGLLEEAEETIRKWHRAEHLLRRLERQPTWPHRAPEWEEHRMEMDKSQKRSEPEGGQARPSRATKRTTQMSAGTTTEKGTTDRSSENRGQRREYLEPSRGQQKVDFFELDYNWYTKQAHIPRTRDIDRCGCEGDCEEQCTNAELWTECIHHKKCRNCGFQETTYPMTRPGESEQGQGLYAVDNLEE